MNNTPATENTIEASTLESIKTLFKNKNNKEIIKKITFYSLDIINQVKNKKINNLSDLISYSMKDERAKDLAITLVLDYGADIPELFKSLYNIIINLIDNPNSQDKILSKILNAINNLTIKK